MKNEAHFKLAIKHSVRKQKGFSFSLAVPIFPGIPDLYVILPSYMPVLLEAKWMEVESTKFDRKIEYRPKQLEYARNINKVQDYAMMGLIGLKYKGDIFAVLTTINPTENRLSDQHLSTANKVARQDKLFDVLSLFRNSPIPLIEEPSNDFDVSRLGELTGCSDLIRGAETPGAVATITTSASVALS